MTTARIRSRVSRAAALTVALALGGCLGAPSRLVEDGPARSDGPHLSIHFDNDARDHVHVYLVGDRREWLLGRVEPGARAQLRIPDAAVAEPMGYVRLAVVAGERVRLRATNHPRATITMAERAGAILAHRWTFSQTPTTGQITALRLPGARVEVGPR